MPQLIPVPTPGQTSSGGGENAAFIASQPQQVLYFGDFNGDGLQDVIETDADFLTGPTVYQRLRITIPCTCASTPAMGSGRGSRLRTHRGRWDC